MSLGSASSRFLIAFACPIRMQSEPKLPGHSSSFFYSITETNKKRRRYIPWIMARRPQPEEMLSPVELVALGERLQIMSGTDIQDFYQGAHLACRIGPGHFPSPRNIQELVQAWKQMRKWR